MGSLGPVDVLTLVLYFIFLFVISILVSRHQTQQQAAKASTETYFLAERSVPWWAVAASLFASNIGSEHFIGLAGSAARDGIAVAWYEVGAVPLVILLGLFFLPTYLNSGIQTTPDYLEKRYSKYCRTMMVCVSLALYVFSKTSATLFAGELILVQLININKWVAVILLVVFTVLYTVAGGLEAVIYTEALQTIILLAGGFLVIGFTLADVGGYSGLKAEIDDESFFHFFRPISDKAYPWTGFVFGYYIMSPWYWGVDQVIVQRGLAARNIANGQLGCVLAAAMKFLPFFIMVLPGIGARVLLNRQLSNKEFAEFNFDLAYPWLVLNVIPKNLRGIIIASMLSSLMSALASVFNSASTLFTLNIWKQLYPESSEKHLVHVGRAAVVVLAIFSLLWLPVMPLLGDRLFLIIQKPPAYMSPPILCLFVFGMLSKYPRRRAGNWTLTFGIIFGVIRFVLEIIEEVAGKKMFGTFTSMNFLHFTGLSFFLCTALLFASSMFLSYQIAYRSMESSSENTQDDSFVSSTLLFRFNLFDELMERERSRGVKPLALDGLNFANTGMDSQEGSGFEMTELAESAAYASPRSPKEGDDLEHTEISLENVKSQVGASNGDSTPPNRRSLSSGRLVPMTIERAASANLEDFIPIYDKAEWITKKIIIGSCVIVMTGWIIQVMALI
uniref:Uncharacterized protein n=1 Tax=Mucochytrium quahogii TaxID=96639 RepID=A0A7S2WT53_9STRA|mmetsp:Transcript_17427/g.28124  ORF Transcript_17427/g.28124 Transcript_17427/m.28124 type:complete len:673 (-) Transcript_17427:834-2852(-)|eukprot:CAMPEP_0203765244 /NCGR_PEP_ID=MMETSP0098-20131031/18305_1 /ASSEMBLY_ACC=CAM_ASM_000208 /TAXON_ID=96639 /ORGANISM=" , Strain NY0313808BC1" /LENGTH=672 /DNA_ID=CAMNT_0050661479 /DNA_START=1593 /DNA_END=3611 /DNA_ORIENTATION=-